MYVIMLCCLVLFGFELSCGIMLFVSFRFVFCQVVSLYVTLHYFMLMLCQVMCFASECLVNVGDSPSLCLLTVSLSWHTS